MHDNRCSNKVLNSTKVSIPSKTKLSRIALTFSLLALWDCGIKSVVHKPVTLVSFNLSTINSLYGPPEHHFTISIERSVPQVALGRRPHGIKVVERTWAHVFKSEFKRSRNILKKQLWQSVVERLGLYLLVDILKGNEAWATYWGPKMNINSTIPCYHGYGRFFLTATPKSDYRSDAWVALQALRFCKSWCISSLKNPTENEKGSSLILMEPRTKF